MDVLRHLTQHHVDSLTRIIAAAAEQPAEVLDRPITLSVEPLDDETTLRSTLNAMVTQEEHWLSALRGGGWPDESDQSPAGLAARHEVAGSDWLAFVDRALAEGRLGDTFLDTTCEPPSAHTVAGTIAHVVTFAAVRRTIAVGALWTEGVRHVDDADPRPYLDSLAGARDSG